MIRGRGKVLLGRLWGAKAALTFTENCTSQVSPEKLFSGKSDSVAGETYSHKGKQIKRSIAVLLPNSLTTCNLCTWARPTLQKQVRSANYNILRIGQPFILSVLDKAPATIGDEGFLKPVLFLPQFGQKEKDNLAMFDVTNPEAVQSLSVHVACKITAVDPSIHLMFSRFGFSEDVGPRGSLYSVLGIHKATNFQTDLDHHHIHLELALSDVNGGTGKLNFL